MGRKRRNTWHQEPISGVAELEGAYDALFDHTSQTLSLKTPTKVHTVRLPIEQGGKFTVDLNPDGSTTLVQDTRTNEEREVDRKKRMIALLRFEHNCAEEDTARRTALHAARVKCFECDTWILLSAAKRVTIHAEDNPARVRDVDMCSRDYRGWLYGHIRYQARHLDMP